MAYSRLDHEGIVARKKRLLKRRTRIIIAIIIAVVLAAGITYGTVSPSMYVTKVTISGVHLADEALVLQTVRDYLDRSFLGVPRWNRFLIGRQNLTRTLRNAFPIFDTIQITELQQLLTIHVSERSASYVWCEQLSDDQLLVDTIPNCAYMDATGFLFERAPYFSQSSRVVFYTQPTSIGTTAVDSRTLDAVVYYSTSLPNNGCVVQSVTVNTFDVQLGIACTYNSSRLVTFMVKPEDDPKVVMQYLQALFRDSDFKKAFKTKPLSYIDARSGSVLYYRFDM